MKTRIASQILVLFSVTALPFVSGCKEQNAGNVAPVVTTSGNSVTSVIPVAQVVPVPDSPVVQPPAVETAPQSPVAAEIPVSAPTVPQNIRISKPLGEVIRLAQAGVDESVILTYVTNSPAIFTLGSEEIVYLNDLGLSSDVIKAMMQRDQTLRYAYATASRNQTSTVVTQETVAVAPTYVNQPQVVPVQEVQPVYVSNNYFYDTLSPYGTWVEVEGYGRCWRPTIVISNPGWRPYCDRGRWVHTDAGWYWMSDYSWGSVAFHYGRWFSHPRLGWCWWPDTVWGPSWVTWRYSNDNCGWAPLPPTAYYRPGVGFTYRNRNVGVSFDFELGVGAFTFVPWGRFCDSRPYQYRIPHSRVTQEFNHTTIINNFGNSKNNTVVNNGIPTDRVREHTRAEVRTVAIQERRERNPRADHFERDGRTLVVNRPALPPVSSGEKQVQSPDRNSSRWNQPKSGGTPVVNVEAPQKQNRPATNSRNEDQQAKRVREIETPRQQQSPTSPVVVTPTPVRTENERPRRTERNAIDSAPASAPIVVTVPKTQTPPRPVTVPTPIFSKPVVVETVPHIPSRPVQTPSVDTTTTARGNRSGQSGGRDYSVWSTPAPQPGASASAPTRTQNPTPSAPQRRETPQVTAAPDYSQPAAESRRPERSDRAERGNSSVRSRNEDFSSRSPGATPIVTPAPRVAPQSVVVQQPAPAPRPMPAYTPPPAPAPSAPRIESQPVPSRQESPAARSESKSDSGSRSNPRNR